MTFKLASRVSASREAADHPHLPALWDQSCTGARAATHSKKMAFIFNSYHRVMNVGAVCPPRKHISYKFVISPATWRADYAGIPQIRHRTNPDAGDRKYHRPLFQKS
jgi:hypothetical protein